MGISEPELVAHWGWTREEARFYFQSRERRRMPGAGRSSRGHPVGWGPLYPIERGAMNPRQMELIDGQWWSTDRRWWWDGTTWRSAAAIPSPPEHGPT